MKSTKTTKNNANGGYENVTAGKVTAMGEGANVVKVQTWSSLVRLASRLYASGYGKTPTCEPGWSTTPVIGRGAVIGRRPGFKELLHDLHFSSVGRIVRKAKAAKSKQ